MKYLSSYEELNPGMKFPSMKDFFLPEPYDGMEEIARYLDNGKVTFVSASYPKDVFTGERIPGEKLGMTDGEYSWTNQLSYYVRKYNLKLPKDFEEKILG